MTVLGPVLGSIAPVVTRETRFFGRLATALGMQDIELGDEEFDRRYRVRSDDPAFAADVLGPATMRALRST